MGTIGWRRRSPKSSAGRRKAARHEPPDPMWELSQLLTSRNSAELLSPLGEERAMVQGWKGLASINILYKYETPLLELHFWRKIVFFHWIVAPIPHPVSLQLNLLISCNKPKRYSLVKNANAPFGTSYTFCYLMIALLMKFARKCSSTAEYYLHRDFYLLIIHQPLQ